MSHYPNPLLMSVPAAVLLALLDEVAPEARRPLTFSCNAKGQIWRFNTNGFTDPRERVYVAGPQVMVTAAATFLGHRPAGGRFELRPDTLDFVAVADGRILLTLCVEELSA